MSTRLHRALAVVALSTLTGVGCAHGRLPGLPESEWREDGRWPAGSERPRIVWVAELGGSADLEVERGWWSRVVDVVAGRKAPVVLSRPLDVHITDEGRLLVTDPGQAALVVFDVEAAEVRLIRNSAAGPLVSPISVTADPAGRIYVSDSALAQVLVFDARGRPLAAWGSALLERPTGLYYDTARGHLHVVDTAAHRVRVLDARGALVREYGQGHDRANSLNFPVFVCGDGSGGTWVVDSMNARARRFASDGTEAGTIGRRGDVIGTFVHPKGITRSAQGHLYVSDAVSDAIQVFSEEGSLLLVFAGGGAGPGRLSLPEGMATDAENRLFVADSLNGRIQIYRYLPEQSP